MAEAEKTPKLAAVDNFYAQPGPSNDDPASAIPEETNLSDQIDHPNTSDIEERSAVQDGDDPTRDESPDPDPAAAEDQESGKAQSTDDDSAVQTLDEFMEYLREEQGLEIDQEFLEGLEVQLKINGEMVSEKLGDALSRARQILAADDYLENAKSKSKSLLEEAKQQKESLGENVVVLGQLIQHAESSLVSEFRGTNWDELRKEDPAEYSARKRDFEEREQQLNALKAQAGQTYREALKKAEQAQDQALQKALPEERKKLYGHLKDWEADIKLAEKESAAAFQYMRDLGYSEDKIKFIAHNGDDLATVVKAMRYDKVRNKSDAEDKRVRKIPRILKSGGDSKRGSKPNGQPKQKDRADILYG